MVDKQRLFNLAADLIRINSENPPGDESKIALFVKNYLEGIGLRTKIYEFKKNRSNVVAVLKGKKRNNSLLLTPHLDTVPAGRNWRSGPFMAKIRSGRLYGLGATDCKGNLASGIEAINSIVDEARPLDYDLIFAATADEECGSDLGLAPLIEKKILDPDAAVVLDSDGFDIVITQKGLIHLKVSIKGKRAHGAYPWMGINAIDRAMQILKELKDHEFHYKKNAYLKPPTLNIGTIRGGDKVNVVADWCEFELDVRFLPGTAQGGILAYIQRTVKKYAAKSKIEIEGTQRPYSISRYEPLVRHLTAAAKKFGAGAKIRGSEGATVISFFQERDIPAVSFGFGVASCAHAANEYAKLSDLYKGALVLEEFLKKFRF